MDADWKTLQSAVIKVGGIEAVGLREGDWPALTAVAWNAAWDALLLARQDADMGYVAFTVGSIEAAWEAIDVASYCNARCAEQHPSRYLSRKASKEVNATLQSSALDLLEDIMDVTKPSSAPAFYARPSEFEETIQ